MTFFRRISLGDRCPVTDEHHKPLRDANLCVNMKALKISSKIRNVTLMFRKKIIWLK